MTPEQTIARNDALRTLGRGGEILLSPSLSDWPAWLRGRVIYRLSLLHKFISPDHSRGCFVFAGYVFYWEIIEREGKLSLSLYTAEDL